MPVFKHILVPVDFGVTMKPSIDLALELAKKLDAQITLTHVFDPSIFFTGTPYMPAIDIEPMIASAQADLKKLCESVKAEWPKVDAFGRRGVPWEQIVAVAKEHGCDLIVIGTHGRRALSHLLLGSVAEKVVRMSPLPVMTVRPDALPTSAANAA